MSDHLERRGAVEDLLAGRLSRRSFISRATVLGLSAAGISSALAACSSSRTAQTAGGKVAQSGGTVSVAASPSAGPTAAGAGASSSTYPFAAAEALNTTLKWPTTAAEPTSPVTLTVSHAWDATFLVRQQQFDQFFMKRHPNIKVTFENTPWVSYLQKYVTQAAGGSLPDLMYCHFSWAQTLIRRGLFDSVEPYIAKQSDFDLADFTKPSLGFYKNKGELHGVAYDCGPLMLFYNKNLLRKHGVGVPDETWTQDTLHAAILKASSGDSKVWGIAGTANPGSADLAPPWLFPFGAQYANAAQTECLIDSPAAVKAMTYHYETIAKKAAPTPAQATAVLPDPFTVGRATFQLNGTWATPGLDSSANFDWGMAPWPRGPVKQSTSGEGSCYAITSRSSQKDAAWIYLNELISQAGMNFMWASTGRGSPARSSAWKYYTSSKAAPTGADLILPSLNEYASSDILYYPQTTEAMNAAAPIWDQVTTGHTTVAAGMKQLAGALTPILAKNA